MASIEFRIPWRNSHRPHSLVAMDASDKASPNTKFFLLILCCLGRSSYRWRYGPADGRRSGVRAGELGRSTGLGAA